LKVIEEEKDENETKKKAKKTVKRKAKELRNWGETKVYNKKRKRQIEKENNTRKVVWKWKNGDVRLEKVIGKGNKKKRLKMAF